MTDNEALVHNVQYRADEIELLARIASGGSDGDDALIAYAMEHGDLDDTGYEPYDDDGLCTVWATYTVSQGPYEHLDVTIGMCRVCPYIAEAVFQVAKDPIEALRISGFLNGEPWLIGVDDNIDPWGMFSDSILDVDYVVSADKTVVGAWFTVTAGGPGIVADSYRGVVRGDWGTDHYEVGLTDTAKGFLDQIAVFLWGTSEKTGPFGVLLIIQ